MIPDRVELTIAEAPQSDVQLGRARIDKVTRHLLGLDVGGVIEITGKQSTVASVFRLMPEDEGKGLLRIDGLIRKNARANPGELVRVKRVDVHAAQEILLAPVLKAGHKITFGMGIEKYVGRGLLKRPLRQGDTIIVQGIALMGSALPFVVIGTKPEGNVRVVEETVILLRETPFHESEGLPPDELLKAFTTRLAESLSALMDEFGSELSKLGGETGERARSISTKLLQIIEELKGKDNP